MATSEESRVTDYLCPIHGGKTMRRFGRIQLGYIKCTVPGCDTLHVEDSPRFKLKKEGDLMEITDNYVKMSKEAYPYLKGFMDENLLTPVWCDGYKIYSQHGSEGTQYTNFDLSIDPPMKGIDKFRILSQGELQRIYMDIIEPNWFKALINFKDWVILDVYMNEQQRHYTSLNELWLLFVMESCFSKFWMPTKKIWGN